MKSKWTLLENFMTISIWVGLWSWLVIAFAVTIARMLSGLSIPYPDFIAVFLVSAGVCFIVLCINAGGGRR